MKNSYDLLQVSHTASTEVIDSAWKALIRQCHPDSAGDNPKRKSEYEERSRELNQAHDVLTDKKKRAGYDASLQFEKFRKAPQTQGINPDAYPSPYPGVPHVRFDPKDIFEEFVTAADLPRAIETAFNQACQAVMAKVVRENPIIGKILEHGQKMQRKGKKTA
jgi:curved DNA-binding protein CbpA